MPRLRAPSVMHKMSAFYRKAIPIFIGLAALTTLSAYIGIERFFVNDALLPAHESAAPWTLETYTNPKGGSSSSVSIANDVYSIDYEYYLTDRIRHPYLLTVLAFSGIDGTEKLVDLSRYSSATFRVKCAPRNVLEFYVHSFDENVTNPRDFYSYRMASALFSCHEQWSIVEIDLRHLRVPLWWLKGAGVEASDQNYRLDKAAAVAFKSSMVGPVNTPAKVEIGELTLHGRDPRYIRVFAGLLVLVWAGFAIWLLRQYTLRVTAGAREKFKADRPLIAYQKLSIEPYRDKEKSVLLRFLATEYANPDMSLEFAVAAVGINRTKINEILKDEHGMTFSACLNKIRLAEAARLLSQQQDADPKEIARLVGYNNTAYFSRLFKNEYGCTPKNFGESARAGKT